MRTRGETGTAPRRRIGHGLHETRQRLRKFFDQCLISVAITAPDKGWVDCNDRISEILGYTRDELRALTWAEITHPDDLDLDCAHFARLLAGEIESYSLEKRFVRRDGRPVWTAISINAVRGGDGWMDYVVGLMEDIDRRKCAEAEMRQARDTLQSLVDQRQVLIAQLQEREERLRQLSRRVIEAQECERRRIAGELHDQIGQSLTMVKIHLQTLEGGRAADAGLAAVRTAVESVDRAIEQVRAMSFALRPPILDDLGIAAALRSHADRQARAAGIEAHLSISTPDRLPRAVETACFRVAEEAIVNVIRHAGARNLWIALARRGRAVELTIRDDGRGFDVAATLEGAQGARLGLSGMIERAASAGGGVAIHSAPGAGAEVRVTFPCAADTVEAPR